MPESAAGLVVQLAQELIEKARRSGVSLVGPDGLLAGVTRTVLQTALDAEMTEHLGYEKGDRTAGRPGNRRNGTSAKTVRTEVGPVELAIPRDRNGSFTPQIVPKHARRVAIGQVAGAARGCGRGAREQHLLAERCSR